MPVALGIILVVLLVRPTGLFGGGGEEGMTRAESLELVVVAAFVAASASSPPRSDGFQAYSSPTSGSTSSRSLGLNILTGYTGQISLGHGAFMAIGGYTTAILVADHGCPELLDDPGRRAGRRRRGIAVRDPGDAALGPLPRARHVRDRDRDAGGDQGVRRPHRRRRGSSCSATEGLDRQVDRRTCTCSGTSSPSTTGSTT